MQVFKYLFWILTFIIYYNYSFNIYFLKFTIFPSNSRCFNLILWGDPPLLPSGLFKLLPSKVKSCLNSVRKIHNENVSLLSLSFQNDLKMAIHPIVWPNTSLPYKLLSPRSENEKFFWSYENTPGKFTLQVTEENCKCIRVNYLIVQPTASHSYRTASPQIHFLSFIIQLIHNAQLCNRSKWDPQYKINPEYNCSIGIHVVQLITRVSR